MQNLLRFLGVSLVAVGLAVLMFVVFLRLMGPPKVLSPVPQESPVQGEQLTQ